MSKILKENMGQSELELDTGEIESPPELSSARASQSDTFTHELLPKTAVSTHKPEPSTPKLLPKNLFGEQKTVGFGQQSLEFGGGNTSGGGSFSGGAGKVASSGFGTAEITVSTSAGDFGQTNGFGAITTMTSTLDVPRNAGGFGGAPVLGGTRIRQSSQSQGSTAISTIFGSGSQHSATFDQSELLCPSTSLASLASEFESGIPTSTTSSNGVVFDGFGLGRKPRAENVNKNVFGNSPFGSTPATLQQSQGNSRQKIVSFRPKSSGFEDGNTSGGGSFSGGASLGGKPCSENANKNVFGNSSFRATPETLQQSQGNNLFGGQKTVGFGQQSLEFGDGNTSGGGSFSGGAGKVASSGFGTAGVTVSTSAGGFCCTSTDLGFGQMSGVGATTTTTTTFGQPSSAGGFGGAPIFGGTRISQCSQPQGFVSADAPSFRSLASNTGPGVGGGHSASSDGGGMFESPDFGGESAGGFGGGYRQLPQL